MGPIAPLLTAISIGSGFAGMAQDAKVQRELDKYIENYSRDINNWYTAEKAKTYSDSPYAKNTIAAFMRRMKEQNEVDQNIQSKVGGTNERSVATKQKQLDSFADLLSSLAGMDTTRQMQLASLYPQIKGNIASMNMNRLGQKSQSWQNFAGNASNTGLSALYAGSQGAFDGMDEKFKQWGGNAMDWLANLKVGNSIKNRGGLFPF